MKKSVFAVLTLLILTTKLSSANPGHAPKGVEVLKLAQRAAAQLESISYEAKFWGEGATKEIAPAIDGKVIAKRGQDYARHRVFIEGSLVPPKSSKASSFRFASDGENISKITESPKVYASGKVKDTRTLERSWLFPPLFMGDSTFERELNGVSIEYEGERKVEGIDCHVVKVTYDKAGRRLMKFYFGKDDHLIRRTERPMPIKFQGSQSKQRAMLEASLVYNVKNLKVNPDVDDAMFRLEYPEGYARENLKPVTRRQVARKGKLAVGSDAPDWTLTSGAGQEVSLKSLRGKVVVLDFWSTWCGPCKRAMPGLERLHQKYKDEPVAILGVNCRERSPKADPMAYIKKMGYTYGQLLDGNSVANAYGVGGIPAFFIIGKDGKLLHIDRGYHPQKEAQMSQIIQKALESQT
ncbi:MAG: redoxin domain-containing protein [Phycisphaerales bacterium]|nr:redoxin domain-containing protein [Phycisphaerales bacterium]